MDLLILNATHKMDRFMRQRQLQRPPGDASLHQSTSVYDLRQTAYQRELDASPIPANASPPDSTPQTSTHPPLRRWTNTPVVADLDTLDSRDHFDEQARLAMLCETCRRLDLARRDAQILRYGTSPQARQSAKHCLLCTLLGIDEDTVDVTVDLVPCYAATKEGTKSSQISGFSYRRGTHYGHLAFSVIAKSPAAGEILRRPPAVKYDSAQTYDQIRRWMRGCADHHANCVALDDVPLPTRLIDVRTPGTYPDLWLPPKGATGQYVALSYCWGRNQAKILTQDALDSGPVKFPLHSLPLTLRHAMVICRNLGYRYIWIDALCIVQDSRGAEDWRRESAKMNTIYGNAALVIAASAASATDQGIFSPLVPRASSGCSVPYRTASGQLTVVDVEHYPLQDTPPDALDMRAWALQEALLSKRLVRFGSHQLTWQCRTLEEHANGPLINWNRQPPSAVHSWPSIITQYTTRKLTYPSDRLAAIEGYARALSLARPHDDYVAGLWRSSLVPQLLWYRQHGIPPGPRPAYRAPTWSWASIDGAVQFSDVQASQQDPIDILQVRVSAAGTAGLTPNTLRLYGCIKRVNAEDFFPQRNSFIHIFHARDSHGLPTTRTRAGEAILDIYDAFAGCAPQNRAYGLRCLKMTASCGLLLRAAWIDGRHDLYERVGFVTGTHFAEWFADVRCGGYDEGEIDVM